MTLFSALLGATLAPSTALPEHPGLLETLEFQGVGLVIVLGALTGIYLLCAGIGVLFERFQRARLAPRQVAPAPEATRARRAEVPVVAIAAAVAAVVGGRPHRVVSVATASAGWSLEGRRQQLTSHQLRK